MTVINTSMSTMPIATQITSAIPRTVLPGLSIRHLYLFVPGAWHQGLHEMTDTARGQVARMTTWAGDVGAHLGRLDALVNAVEPYVPVKPNHLLGLATTIDAISGQDKALIATMAFGALCVAGTLGVCAAHRILARPKKQTSFYHVPDNVKVLSVSELIRPIMHAYDHIARSLPKRNAKRKEIQKILTELRNFTKDTQLSTRDLTPDQAVQLDELIERLVSQRHKIFRKDADMRNRFSGINTIQRLVEIECELFGKTDEIQRQTQ
jgi:hypothetical protein